MFENRGPGVKNRSESRTRVEGVRLLTAGRLPEPHPEAEGNHGAERRGAPAWLPTGAGPATSKPTVAGGAGFPRVRQARRAAQRPQTLSALRPLCPEREPGLATHGQRPGLLEVGARVVHRSAVCSAPQRKLGVACRSPSAKLSKGQKSPLGSDSSRQTAPDHPFREHSGHLAPAPPPLRPLGQRLGAGRGPQA